MAAYVHTFKIKFKRGRPMDFIGPIERNFSCLDVVAQPDNAKLFIETFVLPNWKERWGREIESISHWATQAVEADLRGIHL